MNKQYNEDQVGGFQKTRRSAPRRSQEESNQKKRQKK